MAKTGLRDLRALPDPLLQHNWDLIIPVVPGSSGTERGLTIRAVTTSLPGMMLADVDVIIKGLQLRYAGQRQFTHDLEVTFHETRDLLVRDALLGWQKYARSVDGLTGKYKSQYAVTANMVLYDDSGAEIRTVDLAGFYCKNVTDSQMDSSQQNGFVQVQATFSFDFHADSSGN